MKLDDVVHLLTRLGLGDRGKLSLASLLAQLVDVRDLRDEARRLGLKTKGYRVEKAPARVVAEALADPGQPEIFEQAVELFVDAMAAGAAPEDEGATAAVELGDESPQDAIARLERQNHELVRQLDTWRRELDQKDEQLDKVQVQLRRARERADQAGDRLDTEQEASSRARAEIEELRRRLTAAERAVDLAGSGRDLEAAERQIGELEREQQAILESEEGLRRLLALRVARIRELEAEVAELDELVPKSRRKRRQLAAEEKRAAVPERVRVPYLSPGFYRSLVGKERRSIERAVHAILLFCVEGPAYPGLETKQLEGQDLWSFRAALKLRVYFRFREDGDVDVLALGDREDQNTLLRRLKER